MLRNITFSADEEIIRRARERARARQTTLNEEFRRWLENYVDRPETVKAFSELMSRYDYVQPGRSFRRDEMNGR